MNVLVTGATGFLGRFVVRALRDRGHAVRAVVRPTSATEAIAGAGVEIVHADLLAADADDLAAACEGVDAVVHLAAAMTGDPQLQIETTVEGTRRLLDAMVRTDVRRLVHASSFSVYDWGRVGRTLTEQSPLEDRDLEKRDGYAIAKVRQEQLVRDAAAEHGWELTVLRPGAIWGDRNPYLPDIGQRLGPLHLLIGPGATLKLTYVENCADLFAAVVDDDRAIGQTFNVTDGHDVTNWRYTGDMLGRSGIGGWRIPLPYVVGHAAAQIIGGIGSCVGIGRKLPGIVQPARFRARFMPVHCDRAHLQDALGWQPPYTYEQAMARCFEASHAAAHPVAS